MDDEHDRLHPETQPFPTDQLEVERMFEPSRRERELPQGPALGVVPLASLLVALALVLSCGTPDSGFDGPQDDDDIGDDDTTEADDDDSGDDDSADDDDSSGDDDDDTTGDDDDDTAAPNVIELEDLGAIWECDQGGGTPDDCIDDYLAFVDHPDVVPHAVPMTPEEFDYTMENLHELEYHTEWPTGDPSHDVTEAMNIGFLLDGINPRPLIVTLIDEEQRTSDGGEPYVARQFLFEDPLVGTFRVASRTPVQDPEDDPLPAIIVFHGHGGSTAMLDVFMYPELPLQGYAVFAPDFRGNLGGENEDLVTRTLLMEGFSFTGIRSYEGFLVQKYIDHLPDVDGSRVGVIGQSGGSVTLNAASRVRQYGALVTDHQSQYLSWFEHEGILYYVDETSLGLWPLRDLINDFSTSWTPTLEVPYLYGYHGQDDVYVPMIFEHFADHLDPPYAFTAHDAPR